MSIANRIMGMKQEVKTTEVTKQLAIANKPDNKQLATANKPDVKKMSPQDYAVIKSLRGEAEANRIRAEYESVKPSETPNKPEAVKHLADIAAPEYSLVAEFITPDAKPSRKELESSIASWALQNPEVLR